MAGGSCGFCGARSRMDTSFFYRRLLLAAPIASENFGILRSRMFGIENRELLVCPCTSSDLIIILHMDVIVKLSMLKIKINSICHILIC